MVDDARTQMGISLVNSSREIDESPIPPLQPWATLVQLEPGPYGVCSPLLGAPRPWAPAVYQVLSAVLRVQRWISWFGRWKVYLTNSAKLGHGEVHTCPSNSWELLSIGYLSGKVHGGVFSLEFGSWKVMCFTKGFHLLPPPPESEL